MQEPAILIENLTVRHAGCHGVVTALDGLSLRVDPGTVFGFIGPNGAGKTTTIHVLLGFQAATAGRASLFGCDVRAAIARRRLGYLPEHPDLYRFLSGREFLRFAGRLCGLRGNDLTRRVNDVLETLEMAAAADRRIGTYSRGMRQRICLGQAMLHEPDLLILDEPTSGLDPVARQCVRRLIADWRARGRTVFFSSHELSEVELVCDRVCLIARGRVLAAGAPDALTGPGERLEQYFMRMIGSSQGAA